MEAALKESSEGHIWLPDFPQLDWYPHWPLFWHGPRTDDLRFRIFAEAIAAGDRIRRITRLAFHRGCRIRWFENSGLDASGGIPAALVPVNSREVRNVTVNALSALAYLLLQLPTANRSSSVPRVMIMHHPSCSLPIPTSRSQTPCLGATG